MKEKLMKDIINKIEEYDTIAIYRHVFPDPDSYGSQTALKSIINNKNILFKLIYHQLLCTYLIIC